MVSLLNDTAWLRASLGRLADLHRGARLRVDFSRRSSQHAVYLLAGGCLTDGYIGVTMFELGYQNPLMQTVRFLFETCSLASFLAFLPDGDRRLEAWFNGRIIRSPAPGGRSPKLKELRSVPVEPSLREGWIGSAQKVLYDVYSESSHPTIDAVRFNANALGVFDYSCDSLAGVGIRNLPLEQGLLMPTLQVFGCAGPGFAKVFTQEEYLKTIRPLIVETETRVMIGKSGLKPVPRT